MTGQKDVLLDFGGSCWNGTELPSFSNGLNANEYLLNVQQRFRLFMENRLLITNLIDRLGGDLSEIDWYKPVDFVTYLNDIDNANFIGTVKERYTQVKELGLTKSIRLLIVGEQEAGIYLGTKEEHIDFAFDIANCLEVFHNRDIVLPKVRVIIPCSVSDNQVERLLYREMKDSDTGKNVVVNIVFALRDNSEFTDVMNSDIGMLSLVHWIVNSIEVLAERKVENGIS
jgi:hypothetical protein